MNKLYSLILTLILTTGCSTTYSLGDEWRPLKTIVERPGNSTWVTTVKTRVFVGNLDRFLKRRPVGSHQFKTLMSHELVHAWRQKRLGVIWFKKYLFERKFRLHEELLGHYVEMRLGGITFNEVISDLLRYKPSMGTEQQIRDAAQLMFYGANKPKKSDLPPQLEHLGN